MSDEKFEEFLPGFCDKLVLFCFDKFINIYNEGLKDNDFINLKGDRSKNDFRLVDWDAWCPSTLGAHVCAHRALRQPSR